ncbi:MAG: MFS transporter [SAR202 cluster bacterium Io17-Chloro-G9]|nr:MAG: MFS transporter [SAR202 cluster bacterium Io17-Chloro-G9]
MSPNQEILRFGIRANLGQFTVQTLLVFFVGMTIGLERTVVPLLAEEEFAIASSSVILSFVVSFGFVKALLNLFGGRLSESWGRKPVLIAGWLAAVPIPLMIIFAPNWWWIVAANVLMGVNQGLAWSMTVTSKMDLVGEKSRGLATGINEFAGYSGVAVSVLATGYLAASYGLRPVPFYFGLVVILAALGVALVFAKETVHHARHEWSRAGSQPTQAPSFLAVFKLTTWQDRALFSCSQAGLLHKFADALVWVSFPLYFRSKGLDVSQIGLIVGVYGLTWGILQLVTGPLSDRIGRKWPIVAGLYICGAGVWITLWVTGLGPWLLAAALIGAGMALLYPSMLAAVGDVAHPAWRGTSLGVYRMWRDSGYAFGALLIGLVSDTLGFNFGFHLTAVTMFISGTVVALVMCETAPSRRKRAPDWVVLPGFQPAASATEDDHP